MKGDIVTLYFPGDGVKESSNTATYKGIKEFKQHNNGTISFKTTKHGLITTPCLWRLKENVELGAELDDAPAGNMANQHNRY